MWDPNEKGPLGDVFVVYNLDQERALTERFHFDSNQFASETPVGAAAVDTKREGYGKQGMDGRPDCG